MFWNAYKLFKNIWVLFVTTTQLKNLEKRLHVSTSLRCNNNCIFCLDRGGDTPYEMKEEMNIEEVKEVLRERLKTTDRVLFTFGEPTLNRNLPNFIKLAKKLAYKEIVVVTNGKMLSYNDLCINLIESGVSAFAISIHGHNKKLHNAQTRTKGSFEQTTKGLYNLFKLRKKYHFVLNTASTITKINYKAIYELIKFLINFKPDNIILNIVMPVGNAAIYSDKVLPDYKDVAASLRYAIEKVKSEGVSKLPLTVTDIPFCLMEGLQEYCGFKENIVGDKKENPQLFEQRLVKREECEECIHNSRCRGVYFEYVIRKGWKEFIPIKL